jgi:hypothetical protein
MLLLLYLLGTGTQNFAAPHLSVASLILIPSSVSNRKSVLRKPCNGHCLHMFQLLPSVTRYIYLDTYSLTELNFSWEAANCAATQELPSMLRNPKIHYRVHKSPPLIPILSQINPVHTIPSYLSKIYLNIVQLSTHLRFGLPSGLFLSGFPTNILHAFRFSPILAIWPAHLILFDLIIQIILGE